MDSQAGHTPHAVVIGTDAPYGYAAASALSQAGWAITPHPTSTLGDYTSLSASGPIDLVVIDPGYDPIAHSRTPLDIDALSKLMTAQVAGVSMLTALLSPTAAVILAAPASLTHHDPLESWFREGVEHLRSVLAGRRVLAVAPADAAIAGAAAPYLAADVANDGSVLIIDSTTPPPPSMSVAAPVAVAVPVAEDDADVSTTADGFADLLEETHGEITVEDYLAVAHAPEVAALIPETAVDAWSEAVADSWTGVTGETPVVVADVVEETTSPWHTLEDEIPAIENTVEIIHAAEVPEAHDEIIEFSTIDSEVAGPVEIPAEVFADVVEAIDETHEVVEMIEETHEVVEMIDETPQAAPEVIEMAADIVEPAPTELGQAVTDDFGNEVIVATETPTAEIPVAEFEAASEALLALNSAITATRAQRDELAATLDAVRAQADAVRAEISALQAERTDLLDTVALQRDRATQLESDVADRTGTKDALASEILALEIQLAGLEGARTEAAEAANQRDEAVVARETVAAEVAALRLELTELESARAEAMAAVAQRDAAIAERNESLAAKEAAIAELTTTTEDRDAAIAERDEALASKILAVAAKDTAVTELDAATLAREAAVAERDSALAEREAAFAERDSALAARDAAAVDARDRALADRDVAISDRDSAAAERDAAAAEVTSLRTEATKLSTDVEAALLALGTLRVDIAEAEERVTIAQAQRATAEAALQSASEEAEHIRQTAITEASQLRADAATEAANRRNLAMDESEALMTASHNDAALIRTNADTAAAERRAAADTEAAAILERATTSAKAMLESARMDAALVRDNAQIEARETLTQTRKSVKELTDAAERHREAVLAAARDEATGVIERARSQVAAAVSRAKAINTRTDKVISASRARAELMLDSVVSETSASWPVEAIEATVPDPDVEEAHIIDLGDGISAEIVELGDAESEAIEDAFLGDESVEDLDTVVDEDASPEDELATNEEALVEILLEEAELEEVTGFVTPEHAREDDVLIAEAPALAAEIDAINDDVYSTESDLHEDELIDDAPALVGEIDAVIEGIDGWAPPAADAPYEDFSAPTGDLVMLEDDDYPETHKRRWWKR